MEKKYEEEVYIKIFCQKFSVLQCRKKSWENPVVFEKFSGIEEKYEKEGCIINFGRDFSVL